MMHSNKQRNDVLSPHRIDMDAHKHTEYFDTFAEVDTTAPSGPIVRKDGSLLSIQLYHFNVVNVNVLTGRPLDGLHLVPDRRRGN